MLDALSPVRELANVINVRSHAGRQRRGLPERCLFWWAVVDRSIAECPRKDFPFEYQAITTELLLRYR